MAMFRFLNCYGLSHNVVVNGYLFLASFCEMLVDILHAAEFQTSM